MNRIKLIFIVSLVFNWLIFNFLINIKVAQSQAIYNPLFITSSKDKSEEPDFSGTGGPDGDEEIISRSEDEEICQNSNKNTDDDRGSLIALVPEEVGLTISKHPTFWVYISEQAENIEKIDLTISDSKLGKTIMELSYQIQSTPGIFSLNTSNAKNELTEGETYRWRISIICAREIKIQTINGYIKRVPLNFQPNYENYINYKIWYDAFTDLAQRLKILPNDEQLNNDWVKLLNAKGVKLKELIDQPIVECCELKD